MGAGEPTRIHAKNTQWIHVTWYEGFGRRLKIRWFKSFIRSSENLSPLSLQTRDSSLPVPPRRVMSGGCPFLSTFSWEGGTHVNTPLTSPLVYTTSHWLLRCLSPPCEFIVNNHQTFKKSSTMKDRDLNKQHSKELIENRHKAEVRIKAINNKHNRFLLS